MNKPLLSSRQGYVIAQLYVRFGWAAETIAVNLELGRRTVENTLKRAGVTISRRSKKAYVGLPELSPAAALQWFQRAAVEEQAEMEPSEVNTGTTTMFRRRRCQECGRLTAYTTLCTSCGKELDWKRPSRNETDATELRKLEERRNV